MAKTVADLVIERLIDWSVDTIFGFPGNGINGLFEALRTRQERSDLFRYGTKTVAKDVIREVI